MDADFPFPKSDDEDDNEQKNGLEENAGVFSSPSSEANQQTHDELGLPLVGPTTPPYTQNTIARIVQAAIHNIRATFIGNHDTPEVIVQELDKISRVIKAAVALKSPFLPQIIRLALKLEPRYWMAAGQAKKGMYFFEHLWPHVRDFGDKQLWSEFFTAWGRYVAFLKNSVAGRHLFEWALDEIPETAQEDFRLLLRAELFNVQVTQLSCAEVKAQSDALLEDAERLNFPYIKGRVYYTLARRYRHTGDLARTFEYAQQSLCYFYPRGTLELATQAMGDMYVSLVGGISEEDVSRQVYANCLFEAWEQLVARNINPWYRAAAWHIQAYQLSQQGFYQRAHHIARRAWRVYSRTSDKFGKAQIRHLLGMMYAKQGNWDCAVHHVRRAQLAYEAIGETEHALHAQHVLAYMPVERAKGELREKAHLREAEKRLLAVREAIEARITDPATRERMLRLVEEDIAAVKRRLACGRHNGAKPASA